MSNPKKSPPVNPLLPPPLLPASDEDEQQDLESGSGRADPDQHPSADTLKEPGHRFETAAGTPSHSAGRTIEEPTAEPQSAGEEAATPENKQSESDLDHVDTDRILRSSRHSTWFNLRREMAANPSVQQVLAEKETQPTQMPNFTGYQTLRLLGRGGMGSVYLARDMELDRQVAIKVLNLQQPKFRQRFAGEIKAIAQLQHPNIAQLFATGEAGEQPFFVMEYVPGKTLDDALVNKPQPPRHAAKLTLVLAEAMSYVHQMGLLHRDLKPSNILVRKDGVPKIADFGLAKRFEAGEGVADYGTTRTGEILGTPGYMAPEQASGVTKKLTAACDIYALGGILYRLLTGHAPFDSADPMQTILAVLQDDPIPPRKLAKSVPRDLENICLKCLEKSPGKRYASAQELADDLNRFIAGNPVNARSISTVAKIGKWARRRPAAALAIGSLTLLVGLTLAGLTWHSQRLAKENTRYARLLDSTNQFSNWIVTEHMAGLQALPGSLPPRKKLAENLQRHLDRLKADAGYDAEFLLQLGRSYILLGDVLGNPRTPNLGEVARAAANYSTALQLVRQSLAIHQTQLARQVEVNCLLKQGDVVFAQTASPAQFRKSIAAAEDKFELLMANYPAADLQQLEGLLLDRQLELATLEQDDERVQELANQLGVLIERIDLDPLKRLIQQSGLSKARVGVLTRQGDFESAILLAEQNVDRLQAALENDASRNEQRVMIEQALSDALLDLGDCLAYRGQNVDAREAYSKCLEFRNRLVDREPQDKNARRALAVTLERISQSHVPDSEIAEAIRWQQQAIGIMQALHSENPENRDLTSDLAVQTASLANLFSLNQDLPKFRETADAALRLLDTIASEDMTANNMALRAQILRDLGVAQFQNLMENVEDTDFVFSKQDPDYRRALELLDKSDNQFERLDETFGLSHQQEAFRRSVREMKELFQSTADKLLETYAGEIF